MLLKGYTKEICRPECNPGFPKRPGAGFGTIWGRLRLMSSPSFGEFRGHRTEFMA